MTESIDNPFDLEFQFESEWKEYMDQQQLRDKLSALNTKNENTRPAPLQHLLSPSSSAIKSPDRQSGNSQQHLCEKPMLRCATGHNYALGPRINNPLTPLDDHDHGSYKLDTLLLGLSQPAKQMPPVISPYTTKREPIKASTKGVSKPSKRRYQYPAPSKIAASTPSADPPSPKTLKRAVFFERNRISAYKCREKKKGWTIELEKRARELERCKQQNNIVIASLKSELLYLKTELLRHSGCSTPMRQHREGHIPANLDFNLNGLANDTVSDVGRTGNESSCLLTTAKRTLPYKR